jgi:hypothetical protein
MNLYRRASVIGANSGRTEQAVVSLSGSAVHYRDFGVQIVSERDNGKQKRKAAHDCEDFRIKSAPGISP